MDLKFRSVVVLLKIKHLILFPLKKYVTDYVIFGKGFIKSHPILLPDWVRKRKKKTLDFIACQALKFSERLNKLPATHFPKEVYEIDKSLRHEGYRGWYCFIANVSETNLDCRDVYIIFLRRIVQTYHYENMPFDPLKPHFYIVKLGFTRVYIIFLISAQKHRLWVLVRTASSKTEKIQIKIIWIFSVFESEIFYIFA